MKYVIKTLFVLFWSWSLLAQSSEDERSVLHLSDSGTATYPGGKKALQEYLSLHLRYPTIAMENQVSGEVWVSFLINEQGETSEFQVVRGIGFGCDEEAIKVISEMPHWNPAHENGRAIKTKYVIPVIFEMPNNKEETTDE